MCITTCLCHSPKKKRGRYTDMQNQLLGKDSSTIYFVILITSVKKQTWYLQCLQQKKSISFSKGTPKIPH